MPRVKAYWRWIGIGLICAVLALSLPTSTISDIWYEDQVAVIAYHHIDNHDKSGVTIPTALFESQLTDLKSRGYQFIGMDQFRNYFYGGKVPPNAVLVTFDDGYRSFYTNAYPILQKLDIPAVNFVITKNLEDPLSSTVPSLSRDEIREMTAANKGIKFGCHSDALHTKTESDTPLLTSRLSLSGQLESEEQYNTRIIQDTRTCIDKLRDLKSDAADTYAYPFGFYDASSVRLLKDVGIKFAFTTRSDMVTRDTQPMQIPRLNAGSPYVRSVSLNNLILRKIAESLPPGELIPFHAMEQLGGTARLLKNGEIVIEFENSVFRILLDRRTVVKGANSYSLPHPVIFKDKRNYIRKDDLERLLGITITYNPVKDIYMRSEKPQG